MQGNPKSILVIDDDQELVRAAHMRLRSAGYETREARDGEEGIQEANSRHPDAVLLDIRMPRKDGLAVLGELKRSARTCNIPVVMVSASVVDEKRALDAGARFFLHKPYDGKTLLEAIRTAIHEKQPFPACQS